MNVPQYATAKDHRTSVLTKVSGILEAVIENVNAQPDSDEKQKLLQFIGNLGLQTETVLKAKDDKSFIVVSDYLHTTLTEQVYSKIK